MRDLRFVTERLGDDHVLAIAPVDEFVRDASGGVALGVLATLIDTAGAMVALPAVAPGWIATADLSFHLAAPVQMGPALAAGRLIRAGSKLVVVGFDVFDGRGGESPVDDGFAGTGVVTFARLPGTASALGEDRPTGTGGRSRHTMARPESGLTRPVLDAVGIRVIDAAGGVIELAKSDYVRNSLGAINGGVLGMVFQGAAEAVSAAAGRPFSASDVQIHYLAQAKAGPLRTTARMVRRADDHSVVQVQAVDAGAGDLLLAMATVSLHRR